MIVTLELFTRNDCPMCEQLKGLLKEAGIEYSEIDVDTSTRAKAQLAAAGYDSVPVVRIGNSFVKDMPPRDLYDTIVGVLCK